MEFFLLQEPCLYKASQSGLLWVVFHFGDTMVPNIVVFHIRNIILLGSTTKKTLLLGVSTLGSGVQGGNRWNAYARSEGEGRQILLTSNGSSPKCHFGGPHSKGYSILGSILGSLSFWETTKYPDPRNQRLIEP